MKRSNRLVLLIGIFLAVVAFVLILVALNTNNPPNTGGTGSNPSEVSVVVAARDIPLSATVTTDDLKTKTIPLADKPANAVTDPSFVIGQIARKAVLTDQLITTDIFNPNTTTNVQPPAGYVGVSLLVSQSTGVGTLIQTGDYVDLVMGLTGADKVPLVEYQTPAPTPTPRGNATPGPTAAGNYLATGIPYNPTTVKVLAEGLQVIGTLLPPVAATSGNNTAGAGSGNTVNADRQELVIVAATVQQAEVIKFAQMQGDISLVLRATADCQDADHQPTPCPIIPTTGITLRVLVDDYGVLPPQVVQVIQPSPLPNILPSGHPALVPSPTPSPSPSPSASAAP